MNRKWVAWLLMLALSGAAKAAVPEAQLSAPPTQGPPEDPLFPQDISAWTYTPEFAERFKRLKLKEPGPGGEQNDTLVGGAGDDLLEGGTGYDTYVWNTGDGNDRIEDSDSRGNLVVNGRALVGGVLRQEATDQIYRTLDGSITFEQVGGDLLVHIGSETLTVNQNFQSGQLGVKLVEEADYANGLPDRTAFTREVPDPANPGQTITVPLFDEGGNGVTLTGAYNNLVHALGGNDTVIADLGNDQLYGDAQILLQVWDCEWLGERTRATEVLSKLAFGNELA